jgi:hypothetical protein
LTLRGFLILSPKGSKAKPSLDCARLVAAFGGRSLLRVVGIATNQGVFWLENLAARTTMPSVGAEFSIVEVRRSGGVIALAWPGEPDFTYRVSTDPSSHVVIASAMRSARQVNRLSWSAIRWQSAPSNPKLRVAGAVFCGIIGLCMGFGPKWANYQTNGPRFSAPDQPRVSLSTEPSPPLPVAPELATLLSNRREALEAIAASEPDSVPQPAHLDDVLTEKWDAGVGLGPALITPEAKALLDGQRPMTSVGIRDVISTLPLPDRLKCWAALIENARLEEFPALFHRATHEPLEPTTARYLVTAVAAQWARLDPRGVMEEFRIPKPTTNRTYFSALALGAQEWFKTDPDAVLETIFAPAYRRDRKKLLRILLQNYAGKVDALSGRGATRRSMRNQSRPQRNLG